MDTIPSLIWVLSSSCLPLDDANFQLIISTSDLHYFEDVDVILREVRRVISPNGNLVITDWSRNFFWMRLLNSILPWTHHAHVHTFSNSKLVQSLARAGFSINSMTNTKIDWLSV